MAKPKRIGSGWHFQTKRHSNARKYGKAGGTYKKIRAPLYTKSTKLPIQFSITIPSTKHGRKISQKEFNKRIKETSNLLTKTFKGHTTIRGKGGYVEKGKVDREKIAVIESSMNKKVYKENKKKLAKLIKNKKKEWGQKSIGYALEDDFYIYPAL